MPFDGFPGGSLPAETLPRMLFTDLLPEVDSLAELKVILHIFWRTGVSARGPGFLALDALQADPLLLRSLETEPGGARAAVDDGLTRAVARRAVLRAVVRYRDGDRSVVAPNTERGRRAIAALRGRASSTAAPAAAPSPMETAGRAPIVRLYEENVGPITPILADELRAAGELYPAPWIEEAFKRAVSYNRRNWRYVKRILERWATEGRDADATPGGRFIGAEDASAAARWTQTYRRGQSMPGL